MSFPKHNLISSFPFLISVSSHSSFLLLVVPHLENMVCIYLSLCVCTYHVCNNYVTYIVAMRPYLNRLRQFRRLLCAATMSSPAQLRVWDTEKQRQHRHNNARLAKSGNARSKQLLVMPTESLANREWLPGEFLSGSEHLRPGWFFDIKYQTCFFLTADSITVKSRYILQRHSGRYQIKALDLLCNESHKKLAVCTKRGTYPL